MIENYTNDNGLPQNSVTGIQQDASGYCWLATEMGLVRWDGRNFKTYNSSDIPGVSLLSVKSLTPDNAGNIYAWLNSEGKPTLKIKRMPGLMTPEPVKMEERQQWIFNNGWWMSNEVFNQVKMSESWKTMASLMADRPPHQTVFTLPGNKQLYIIAREGDTSYLYFISGNTPKKLQAVNQMFPSLITVDHTLVELDGTGHISLWKDGEKITQPAALLGDLYHDKNYRSGNKKLLWCISGSFVYGEGNLYQLFFEQGVLKSKKVLTGLNMPDISCMYYLEAYDTYLFGSLTRGLFVVKPTLFCYPSMPATGMSENFYSQLLLDSASFFCRDVLFSRYYPSRVMRLGTGDSRAFCRVKDDMFFEKGLSLCSYSFKTGKTGVIGSLDSRLKSILVSAYDNSLIYFCTEQSYLGTYSLNTAVLTPPGKKLFKGRHIYGMVETGRDSLLLFGDHGLTWYDVKNGHIYKTMLEQFSIRNIYREQDGKIWVSVLGKGIMLINKTQVYSFPADSRRAVRVLHDFIEDGKGNFWMPSNDGLLKVNKTELLAFVAGTTKDVYYYRYDKTYGLRTNEFNGGCLPTHIRFFDGMLSLPSLDGLVWFYPDKAKTFYPTAAIYIEQVKLDGDSYDVKNGVVELAPDFERLHIKAGSPYFGIKENQRIQYRVEGINNTWADFPDDGIVLNAMHAGSYTLVLRKQVGRYVNDFIFTRLQIKVQPWFYNTWWFRLLIIGLFLATVFIIATYRVRLLKKRAKKLEEEVADRTSELNNTVIDLKKSEEELKESTAVKDMMTTLILHDLRSPLRFMDVLIQHIAGNITEAESSAIREELEALQKTSQSLSEFSQTFFTWATSQHANFKIVVSHFPLQPVFDELVVLYQPMLAVKDNTIQALANDITCSTDKNILSTILRNLLDNANKNNTATHIIISAVKANNMISITVADNGTGMDETMLAALRKGLQPNARGNIGYRMMADLSKKIGGTLHIDSTPREGTRVTLVLQQFI